jgi:excinuclease ABC subunit B
MSIALPKNYKGIVKQIIRPTGLLDPVVEIRPSLPETFDKLSLSLRECGYEDMPAYKKSVWTKPQIPDLVEEIEKVIKNNERALVTTLTKRMAEELSDYLIEKNIKSKYLHSDIDTVERVEILRDLRKGIYDVVVGINLLREGLDLPEVSLVAILDADKEGFLRSDTSLIQIIGRAARHHNGKVIMYADTVTKSMKRAIDETRFRRKIQEEYNKKHGITPQTIKKSIDDMLVKIETEEKKESDRTLQKRAEAFSAMSAKEQKKFLKEIRTQMEIYSDMLEFEKAAELRDLLLELENGN